MVAIGLMSGTSLDGVDAALVSITGVGTHTSVSLKHFITYPMPSATKQRILRACNNAATTSDIAQLSCELGLLFAQAACAVCSEAQVDMSQVSYIASHGQTVWHEPHNRACAPQCAGQPGEHTTYSTTLQLGDSATIAYHTGCRVISNFRTMDIAAGGQGAPLVPYSEFVLYCSNTSSRVLLNIGGIANLTCIPCKGQLSDVFAFDCGPGNMMIDEACRELLGCEFDANGAFAQRGNLIEPLYRELTSHPYFKEPIPKSTGREQFGAPFVRELLARYSNEAPYNIVHTLAKVTVYGIADSYTRFVAPTLPSAPAELIVAGGGAHNAFLMHELARALPDVRVVTQDELGYSSDAKEAIAFAILGNETLNNKPSNVPAATGAVSPQILGEITPAPYASAAAVPTADTAATVAAPASMRAAVSAPAAVSLD